MIVTTSRAIPDIPRLHRDTDARAVGLAVYDDLLELLEDLDAEAWERTVPDCPAWTVADVVGHLIGAARSHISMREMARQQLHGRRHRDAYDGNDLDAVNDLQVRDHADLTVAQRLATLRHLAPRAVAARMETPALIRRLRMPMSQGGSTAAGMPTHFRMGNLLDAVLTRDVWMHRIDILRALDRPIEVTSDADRRVVEDVVAEWGSAHGEPFRLELTGPAGGHYHQGTEGPDLTFDAVEFCRALSGRLPAAGLLAHRILF